MSGLGHLKQATDAAYQAEQAKLSALTRQEAALRQALADLDGMHRDARALSVDQMAAPRAIGAEMLWQGWVQRRRQQLNVELAGLLVTKAARVAALARAFGRAETVAGLVADEKTARRKAALDRELQDTQALALLRGATFPGGSTR